MTKNYNQLSVRVEFILMKVPLHKNYKKLDNLEPIFVIFPNKWKLLYTLRNKNIIIHKLPNFIIYMIILDHSNLCST